ncbi:MAG: sugar ABC transporter permease [Clostridiaceae bacterium]
MSTNIKAIKRRKISKPLGFCIAGLMPIMLLYTYLRFVPIFSTFYISFHNWNMVSSKKPFIGLENYRKLFQNPLFIDVLKNTTIIAFSILIITLPLSLIVANALISKVKTKSFFESIYFLPVIMPMVPITIAWKGILGTNNGIFNYFLSFFGIKPLAWMTDPTLAIVSVIIITVWKNLGYNMLIFSVGLTGISREYYEAASIDGATGFKSFRYITIPLLKPVTLFISIMTLIKGYNVFSTVYILASDTQGSPGYIVRVLVYDMFENGFRFFKMGLASAEAVILFMIVFALTLIQFTLNKERIKGRSNSRKRVKA